MPNATQVVIWRAKKKLSGKSVDEKTYSYRLTNINFIFLTSASFSFRFSLSQYDMRFTECDVDELRAAMSAFCAERAWQKFHTPRNLLLALVGEVGELSEIFQWRGDAGADPSLWSAEDRVHLGQELSDVLLYLVRLSDVCGIDLPAAARSKMAANAAKYPVDRARGRSLKYTQLAVEAEEERRVAGECTSGPSAASPAEPGSAKVASTNTFLATAALGVAILAFVSWRAR